MKLYTLEILYILLRNILCSLVILVYVYNYHVLTTNLNIQFKTKQRLILDTTVMKKIFGIHKTIFYVE